MNKLSKRQEAILESIKRNGGDASFSVFFEAVQHLGSARTIKRDLADLVRREILTTAGGGRSLTYSLPIHGRFFIPIDPLVYTLQEPDARSGALTLYQFDIWKDWSCALFSTAQYTELHELTKRYQERVSLQSEDIRTKELERFVIELSWKSSRIEGNTYTLLDTELLIKEGIASSKNTKEETQMILNHKHAFDFVRENPLIDGIVDISYIDQVHTLLMKGLITDLDLRKSAVGITGSTYRPLAMVYQIEEALQEMISSINRSANVFDKALTILFGISYIQPFVDGNKRTARLVANALLFSLNAAPLSYRSVEETTYRASLLAFYEQLSVLPMQEIFMEQYRFAVEHYS